MQGYFSGVPLVDCELDVIVGAKRVGRRLLRQDVPARVAIPDGTFRKEGDVLTLRFRILDPSQRRRWGVFLLQDTNLYYE
jgi:hypothetical protein